MDRALRMSNVMLLAEVVQRPPVALLVLLCGFGDHVTTAQTLAAPPQPLIEVRTEVGTMIVTLYNETPVHRDNFMEMVRKHGSDSLRVARIIPEFMIQGGETGRSAPVMDAQTAKEVNSLSLPAEIVAGLVHRKGALGALRLPDELNPELRSSVDGFYIVHGKPFQPDELERLAKRSAQHGVPLHYTEAQIEGFAKEGGAPHLDGKYTVFGQVVEGLEVVDAIASQPRDANDRPLSDIHLFMRVLE